MEPQIQSTVPISIFIQHLNETQKRLLKEFRKRLENELSQDDDDIFLLRFLKARNFEVDKAEKMIREHLKFRKKMDVEMKNYEMPEIYQKYLIMTVIGNDKDGDPILHIPAADSDFRGFAYSVPMFEQIKFCVHTLYESFKISKKPKHEIMSTMIFDIDNMSFSYLASKLVLRQHMGIIQMYEQNFPESLKRCFVINAPSVFQVFFNIYKQIIDPKIVQKIMILGKNDYQALLREVVDEDVLPKYLGGNRPNPIHHPENPNTMLRGYQKIPSSYYMTSKFTEANESDTNDVCIKERANYDYRVKVDQVPSTIKWYFRTVNYNIKFGLFYVSDKIPQTPKLNRKASKSSNKSLIKNGYEELYPAELVESHIVPERGEHVCENVGTYVFRFDNSYSWMTPKELRYKVEVIPKEDNIIKESF